MLNKHVDPRHTETHTFAASFLSPRKEICLCLPGDPWPDRGPYSSLFRRAPLENYETMKP